MVDKVSITDLVIRLATDVDQIAGRGAGQSHVRLARFTGAVDDAADHRHIHRRAHVFETILQLVHGGDHIEVLPRATRTGHEIDAIAAQLEALEDVETDLDLFDRVRRQRHSDGVADAFIKQHAQPDRRLHGAAAQAAGLGDTQMQRLLDLPGQPAIGVHRHKDFRGFHRDLEVRVVVPVENIHVTQGRLDQRLGRGLAVLALQILADRAGIDADADGDTAIASAGNDLAHLVIAADIARVDTQAIDAIGGDFQGDAVIEVNVGNERHADLGADFAKRLGRVHAGNGDAHDVGARAGQRGNLGHGSGHIAGFGIGHALHADRGAPPHRHLSDVNLTAVAPLDRRVLFHGGASCLPDPGVCA